MIRKQLDNPKDQEVLVEDMLKDPEVEIIVWIKVKSMFGMPRHFLHLQKDKGLTLELRKDAGLISSVCATSSDFILMLESPVVKTSQKVEALKRIFEGKINVLSLNFLLLIAENKRENYIPGIFRES